MTIRTRRLLDLYTDYFLISFGQATATGLAALLPQVVSHDQVTRFLSNNEFDGKDLWKVVKPHVHEMQSEDGCLIFDDTIEEKPYTDSNELIGTYFDHVTNRYVKGVNILTGLYYSRDIALLVDFELIQKTKWVTDPKTGKESFQSEETKNAIMRRMIEGFIRKQVPFRYVLADIWFACVENMVFIKQKKRKDFVFPLKSNRRIALSEVDRQNKHFVSVSDSPIPTACKGGTAISSCRRIYLDKVPFPLLLIASVVTDHEGNSSVLYLVTSDLTLDASAMLAVYKKRWKIEEFHKSLKSNAAFAKSPTKRVRTQSNHFFASLVAFTKMEVLRVTTHLNHFAMKAKLCQAALAAAFERLTEMKKGGELSYITS